MRPFLIFHTLIMPKPICVISVSKLPKLNFPFYLLIYFLNTVIYFSQQYKAKTEFIAWWNKTGLTWQFRSRCWQWWPGLATMSVCPPTPALQISPLQALHRPAAFKDKGLDTCYSTAYISQTRDQQHFTISLVAADWHEPMVPHPLPALTNNCTHGAASRHTVAPISHTRPPPWSPQQVSYYSFPVLLRVGGWVGLSTQ